MINLRTFSTPAGWAVALIACGAHATEPPVLKNNPFSRPLAVSLPVSGSGGGTSSLSDDDLELTATMVSGTTRYASINGRIVKEGDTIINYEVRKIFEDRVLIAGNKLEVVVYVKPQSDEHNEQSIANR